jgi:hypothetical protein
VVYEEGYSFLEDSRTFGKQLGIPDLRSGSYPSRSKSLSTPNSLDSFNIFELLEFSANRGLFPALTYATRFGTAFALERDAMLRINSEADMWKITTRGFTLEEVLIMAVMNLLASGDNTSKRDTRGSQEPKGDQACNLQDAKLQCRAA